MKNPYLVSTIALMASTSSHAAQLVSLWEFGNPTDLAQATYGGSALTLNGTPSATTGVTGGDGAANVPKGAWLSVPNTIGANGAVGTPARTNQFSIVLDFMIPDFKDSATVPDNGVFTGLFDFDGGGSDADYFIRKQSGAAELGISTHWSYVGAGPTTNGDGNTGTVRSGTWYRLILAADTGAGRSVYLNGNLIGNHNAGTQDSTRHSLTNAFRVMWDNDGETSETIISNLALYSGRMSAAEALALGTAGTQIVPANALPAMVVADAGISPVAPGISANYSFSATDAEGDPVQIEVDWGDGQVEAWSPLQAVASPYVVAHTYAFPGSYVIKARARDSEDDATTPVVIQTISVLGKQVTWTGALDTEWSAASLTSPKNWVLTSDGVTAADFATGDDVVIDDSASGTTLAINGTDVTPFTVSVNNPTKDITLSGSQGIGGPTGLQKSGAGELLLANPNSFQGETSITEGIITINHSQALANSVVATTYPVGNLRFGTVAQATVGGLGGGGDLALDNASSQPVALTLGKNGVTSTHAGEISGTGSLVKTGTGTQVLNFVNLFSGGTTLSAGDLRVGNSLALGTGPVVLAGGSLTFSLGGAGTIGNDISLPATAYQTFIIRGAANAAPSAGAEVTLAGKISGGTAGLTYRLVDSNATLNHNNVLVLANPANDFQGNIELWRGFLGLTSDAALGNADNDIRLDCNNGNGGLRFDADGITLGTQRSITLAANNNQEAITVPSGTGTIAGPVVGVGAMVKRGGGELVLSSPSNTFTGNVSVAAGKLTVNGSIATSANPVTVTAAGTLGGAGTINRAVTVTGTVAPGSSVGTLTVVGTTTLPGIYQVDVDGASSDQLVVTGDLNLTGATLDVAVLGGGFTQPSYVIGTYSGNLTGEFASVTPGYTVTASGGQIVLAAASASGFTAWATLKGVSGFNNDSDNDGIANGIEFVIGGEPAAGAGSNSSGLFPTVSRDAVTGELVFVFRRMPNSAYLNPTVEYSVGLTGGWTSGPAGTVIGTAGAAELVEVRLPSSLAPGGRIFARLKVSE